MSTYRRKERTGSISALRALKGDDRLLEGEIYHVRETGEVYVGTTNPDKPIKQTSLKVSYVPYNDSIFIVPAMYSASGHALSLSLLGLPANMNGVERKVHFRGRTHATSGVVDFAEELSFTPGEFELGSSSMGVGNKSFSDWLNKNSLYENNVNSFPALGNVPSVAFSWSDTIQPFIVELLTGYSYQSGIHWDYNAYGRHLFHFGVTYYGTSIKLGDGIGYVEPWEEYLDPSLPYEQQWNFAACLPI
jgi:hypothetical protein